MPKYTPGPWRVEGRYVMALKEKAICECPGYGIRHGNVDKANARLIAVVPELLKLCKETEFRLRLDEKHFMLCESLRTVIAKTEGE